MSKSLAEAPIGATFAHPTLGRCRVLVQHGAGTVDVERLSDGKCFRLTGLRLKSSG